MKRKPDTVLEIATQINDDADSALRAADELIEPYRKTAFQRFPVLFALLVTFGVSATFFAFERILSEVTWLITRPYLILIIGIVTLAITGTLYKKLS